MHDAKGGLPSPSNPPPFSALYTVKGFLCVFFLQVLPEEPKFLSTLQFFFLFLLYNPTVSTFAKISR